MTFLLWYLTFWEHTRACSTLASFLGLKGRAAAMTVPTLISAILDLPRYGTLM
jgi:hypothetical protein